MPRQADDRLLIARRVVAEKCLYGVDLNPMAVELAKLSIWLITLSKGRPFGFLDHNLRHGDSLLGTYNIEQLKKLNFNAEEENQQLRIFGDLIEKKVAEVLRLRKKIRGIAIIDIYDVKEKARIDQEARERIKNVELVANAMVGEVLRFNSNNRVLEKALDTLSTEVWDMFNGNKKWLIISSKSPMKD
ncbi:type II restriction enzyme, methylase subunits [Geomicrobium sp. JCM 19039]|nr:type II restriction enzyme, methylase subunits [Geomicrobium sp. JCM 19039]